MPSTRLGVFTCAGRRHTHHGIAGKSGWRPVGEQRSLPLPPPSCAVVSISSGCTSTTRERPPERPTIYWCRSCICYTQALPDDELGLHHGRAQAILICVQFICVFSSGELAAWSPMAYREQQKVGFLVRVSLSEGDLRVPLINLLHVICFSP